MYRRDRDMVQGLDSGRYRIHITGGAGLAALSSLFKSAATCTTSRRMGGDAMDTPEGRQKASEQKTTEPSMTLKSKRRSATGPSSTSARTTNSAVLFATWS